MSDGSRSLLPALGAAAVTAGAAPFLRAGLVAIDMLDVPNDRSSHAAPVPRGGGLACALGVATAVAAHPRPAPGRELVGVAALTLVGLADDRRGLPAVARLSAQLAVGAVAGSPGAAGVARGAVVVPAAVNVVNFMDGINGISGLTALAWGLHAARVEPDSASGQAVAGAGLGFLPWNLPRARLFLGDSGSYLLGSLVGTSITRAEPRVAVRLALPLAPYLLDAGATLARRALAGRDVMTAHREHAYQRLVHEHGFSHVQVAGAHALLVAALGQAARRLPLPAATVVAVGVGGAWAAAPEIVSWARRRRTRVSSRRRRPTATS